MRQASVAEDGQQSAHDPDRRVGARRAAEDATENEDNVAVLPHQVYSKEELRQHIQTTEPGTIERLFVIVPALTAPDRRSVGRYLGGSGPEDGKVQRSLNLSNNDRGKPLLLGPPKTASSRRTFSPAARTGPRA
jgi:hypothetical protein